MANLLSNTTIGGYQSIHTGNVGSYAITSIPTSFSSITVTSSFDTASNDIYASMRVIRNNSASNADGMYIGYGNSGSGITRIFGGGATGGALEKYATYTVEPGSFRAPIFYDSADTSYYLDLNSTSYLYHLVLSGNSYFRPNTWIEFNGNYGLYWPSNYGLHIYPNAGGSYGALQINGTKGGWAGIYFNDSGNTIMANSNESGFHRQGNGWQFRWTEGTMYVHRSNSGGGTAHTVLDTGNYNSFSIPTKQYIWSRGENLLTNGTGLMGNNTNFSSFTFDGSQAYFSSGSFKYTGQYHGPNTDELMPVNPEKRYRLDFWAKTLNGQGAYYAFLNFFDVDGNAIVAPYHMYYANTLTTLAQTLNPGDTVAYLTSAANWENGGTAGVSTHIRSFIFWNYTNSFGYTYPPQTYSRNWYSDAWNPGAINSGNNTITLRVPWSGPSIAAGTQVSNGSAGGTYKYIALGYTIVPTTWTNYVGIMDGVDYSGSNAGGQFPPGTAAAKLGFLTDYNASGDTIFLANLFVGVDNDYPIYDKTIGNTKIEKSGAFYGTTFIDSNDNNFYLNPNGTSRLSVLNTTGTITTDAYLYTNYNTRIGEIWGYGGVYRSTGEMLFGTEGYAWRWHSGNVQKALLSSDGFFTTAGGMRVGSGDLYLDQNYGRSVVGLYASDRYQGVFAMGDSYKLAANGTSAGSLYGIAWTHTNVGGESKSGLGHQALFMANGSTQTAIGYGIWTVGLITTTSYGTSANWNTAYGWGNHASAGYLTGITSGQVTGALGYTPYNSSNPSGYITSSALSGYATQSYVNSQGFLTSLPSHNHDDRYYTETESDGRFQPLENQRLSTGNSPTFANVYATAWFRNYGAQGMYNQDYGTHFYSLSSGAWAITGSGGAVELQFRSNHQSTVRGYVYADTSNNIGFLNNGGNWSLRTDSNRNTEIYGNLTLSGSVYQGLSNQGVISLLSDVVVGQTNNYFRLYLPQGYVDNRNGGTATIKIVWGMLHAGITYSQEYKLTFGTNHSAGGNYLIVSDVTRTYKDQNPDSYGGYLMDQTPAVDFYQDTSGGYINFNVKGYQNYNTHRVVAVDIVGGGVGTPTLTYYGASSPGGTALTVKDIPYATTAGALSSMNISQFTNNSGYITGYTETDTLASVTGRGATTSTPITISTGSSQPLSLTTANSSPWHLALNRTDLGLTSRVFAHNSPYNGWYFEHNISIAGNTNWHSGNLTNLNQLTNGPGYLTGITSGNVTTALGYTPYNATNPNGYITGISFASVSSKPTTISGYGITDAITTGNIGSQSVSYAATAGSAPNAGNVNDFYNVTAGNGYGLKFWNSDNYKISMGVGALYQYGPVTDYSIKMQMNDSDAGRGFTWGRLSYAPIAALNSTSGDMEVAGYYKSYGYRGNGNVGGTGSASWHPDGIYCGSTMWQYGSLYKNNTGIYNVSEMTMNSGPTLSTYNTRNLIVRALDNNADVGILGQKSGGGFAFQIYGTGSSYGFLNGTWAAWDIRKAVNGAMYMNDNDSYYLQTNSTSNFYALNIQGNAVVHAGNISSQSVSYATTAGTANAVAWTNVSSRPTALSQFTNDLGNYGGFLTSITAHSHAISDVTGLQTALDGKQAAGSYAASSHTHDDRYYTESESDTRFARRDADSAISGNLVIGNGTYGNSTAYGSSGARLMFSGSDTDAQGNYYIGTNHNDYGGNYSKLELRWHTGIRMGAQPGYGGIRFYDTEDLGTVIFSVGTGDSHVRVVNNLYVGGNLALHAGNYNSYSPTLTGTGASGTWGISISGNAATATNVAWTGVTSRPTALSQFTNDLGNYGGWITGINSGNVTTALGFTPYNATNPSGYITSSASISGNAATATYATTAGSAPANGGNSTTVGGYTPSGSVGANTVVIRDANNYIYAHYINSNVSEAENPTINSFYTSNGDGWLRKSSVAHVKSQLGLGSMAYESSGTYQTVSGAINTGNIASQSVSYATISQQLTKFGDIYGQDWNGYFITGKLIVSNALGHTGANRPSDSYGYGTTLSYGETGGPLMQMYFPEDVGNTGGAYRALAYRSGYNGGWSPWKTVVNQVGNTCTVAGSNGTGLQVHSNVGYNQNPLTYFLLRGQADSSWKTFKILLTGDAGGQDIEFRRIAENSTDARIFYVPRGLNQVIFDYTVVQPSDSRLKDNLTPITNPVDKIKSLRGVEFDWNSGEHVGTHDVGLIAQDVEAVLPEAVTTQEDGYKNLAYTKVIPLLVEAMKEQQTMIEALRAEIELLKNK